MAQNARTPELIGIVGDRDAQHPLHLATERALADAAGAQFVEWIATDRLANGGEGDPGDGGPGEVALSRYAGFLVSPGSPYRSMQGALRAIRYARENRVPLLGTCGGLQYMLVEFARNVAGLRDADHAETNPNAPQLAVTPLVCSLAGQIATVRVMPGTLAASVYGTAEIQEPFFCTYGLNPEYRPLLESRGLRVSGFGTDGEVRIVELPAHPFFVGTLYVPQARHVAGRDPHPLIRALVAAGRSRAEDRAEIRSTRRG
jgi:CTP synthase (UTP-ammonia lyase)